MNDEDRIKRPKPERDRPLRSMSSFLGTDARDGRAARGDGAANGEPRLDDVVSRSVDLGYRVIDEYVRQGQRVARGIGERSYSPGAMVSDLQELSGRLAEYAADFASVWSELIQLAARSGLGQATGGTAAPEAPVPPRRSAPDREASTRLRITVIATRAAEVSVDLRGFDDHARLLVHALRAVDPAKPRIADVTLSRPSADESPELRIRIPDDQPAGTYSGIIVDAETNRPVGTVSVSLPNG